MEGFVHPDFAPVTEKVQAIMAKKSARGGMAVAVYHHGELVVDAWTGVRNIAGDPWLRETMSMSFSTTKGVVATIVQRLVDQGCSTTTSRSPRIGPSSPPPARTPSRCDIC